MEEEPEERKRDRQGKECSSIPTRGISRGGYPGAISAPQRHRPSMQRETSVTVRGRVFFEPTRLPVEHLASPAGRASTTGPRREARATPPRPVWCKPLLCAALILATWTTEGIYPSLTPSSEPDAMSADPRREMGRCSGDRVHLLGRHLANAKQLPSRPGRACCLRPLFPFALGVCLFDPGWWPHDPEARGGQKAHG